MRVVVLASGTGSLFRALCRAQAQGAPFDIVALVADKPCGACEGAAEFGIPSQVVALPAQADAGDRGQWNRDLAAAVGGYSPDLVVSAGFMRIVGPEFLEHFGGRMLNTHPALLPAFPGAHAVADALAYGAKVTGCTVHLVDAGVDTGPIVAQEAVEIHRGDTVDTVHERIKVVERRLIVEVVSTIAQHGYISDGRKAYLLHE